MSAAAEFVHLRLHTEFSLVDSIVRVEPLVRKQRGGNTQSLTERAAEMGLPALAVTDRNNLCAMVKFYKAAEAAGIKPIVGADVYLEPSDADAPERLTVLVQNAAGYRALTQLLSRAYTEGQVRGEPLIRREWLWESNAGLIVLSGADGAIGRLLLAGHNTQARRLLEDWTQVFGDRFYLEIARCGRPQDELHLAVACALARASGVGVVATNDVRFLRREDFDAHEARVCIHQQRLLEDPRRPRDYSPEQYLKSVQEMRLLFADLPEALQNSVEIARRCTLSLKFGAYHLPQFPGAAGSEAKELLAERAREGLQARLAAHPPAHPVEQYHERLRYELDVIVQMQFEGYFLVVADFIAWAKSNDVPVGPGRGSGAGSLVAYAIGITDLDPLRYALLFERFLNPERISLPDFDVDFCIEGRDRVIEYVASRYGRERVGQIITYQSLAARAAVRDAARVLGYPYAVGDRISKMIPGSPAVRAEAERNGYSELEHALREIPELRDEYQRNEEVRAVSDLALLLEGLTRGVGKHAGGVVIAPKPLTEYTPLYCEPGGAGLVTQFDMKDLEAVGLVKFDFLGLRTLTIIRAAIDQINRRVQPPIDALTLPLDDPKAFRLYATGQTAAVFQMESEGMRSASIGLKPDHFEDIIALISLYRPGPMELIPEYVARKNGKLPEYLHAELAPILNNTYGIIVYQEQVMQIAQRLAGYTLGGADLLRRAMGKKLGEEMAKQRSVFVEGARARAIDAAIAGQIFDLMEKFAAYGFNRSHAAAYALVSYQTAWLKAHYPGEFMAAVLSAEMAHTDKLVPMLDECRRMNLKVLAPDINRSEYRFTVPTEGEILYGLGGLRGVGSSAVETVVEQRERGGPFKDIFDLCRRVDPRRANRRVLEAFIRAGALDGLGPSRPALMASLQRAVQLAEQTLAGDAAGQTDLFGLAAPSASEAVLSAAEDWSEAEKLAAEKEVLGLYLSGHPVEEFRDIIEQVCSGSLRQLIEAQAGGGEGMIDEEGRRRRGPRPSYLMAGWLSEIRRAAGDRSGRILILDDRSAQIACWLDYEGWDRQKELLRPDSLIFVLGEVGILRREGREPEPRIYSPRFFDLAEILRRNAETLQVVCRSGNLDVARAAARLKEWRNKNGVPVVMELWSRQARGVLELGADWRLSPEVAAIAELRRIFGAASVRVCCRRGWQGAEAASPSIAA